MGLDYYTTRFLLQARQSGADFGRVLTIGRQNFFVTAPQLARLAREFHLDLAPLLATQPQSDLAYVEPFFTRILGATAVESLDVSTYEGATHVHDMNAPLPEPLHNRYDTVFEAGSLEHIFNFPTALKNLMLALRPGGRLFIQSPANNYFGHGFYQFSPELYYRVLSPQNGFEILRMQLFEHLFPAHFFATPNYRVTDPAAAQQRVQLVNQNPTLLNIEAIKHADKPIFAQTPQQSDYVPLWTKNSGNPAHAQAVAQPTCLTSSYRDWIYKLPLKLANLLPVNALINRRNKPALSNPDFFNPAD